MGFVVVFQWNAERNEFLTEVHQPAPVVVEHLPSEQPAPERPPLHLLPLLDLVMDDEP